MIKTVFQKILVLCCLLATTATTSFAQKPDGLMCDLLANTDYRVGGLINVQILNRCPSFSWIMNSNKGNATQSAYQIIISKGGNTISSKDDNFWNSGKIITSKSTGVKYTGPTLQPDHSYRWKVRVWNEAGKVSPYSENQNFKMGDSLMDYATERYRLQKTDQNPILLLKRDGVYFADFGKDAFGQPILRLRSKSVQDTVIIRIGEALDAKNMINRKPGGAIRYAEYRIPLRAGTHVYPITIRSDKRNTGPNAIKMPDYIGEVTPFRYCEIDGYRGNLQATDVTRSFVHYPFNDEAATFVSSDSVLNKVWDLCKHTIKATSFTGVYIDGDRERTPYEADAYINQLSDYAVDREYSLARFSHEYLINHATWPTEWILQSVLIAGNDYLYTGDIRSARNFYDQLKDKCLMALEDSTGLISSKNTTEKVLKDLHLIMRSGPYGLKDIVDWPHTGQLGLKSGIGGETDGFVFTDYNAVVNGFYYKALVTMETIAADLGKTKDAAMFKRKSELLKRTYQKLFWDANAGVFCDGITTRHASLHTNAFALALGLADPINNQSILTFIRSRGMACSVYGSQFLLDAVYDGGDGEYGLELLTSKAERSWYNMIEKGGTLTMEAWDNSFKPNQDWNHPWGSAPANIISRKLMGVEPLTPGWETFQIAPKPGSLKNAAITVPTIKGTISLSFEKSDHKFLMKTLIPANTLANIYLPMRNVNDHILLDQKRVKAIAIGKTWLIRKLGSGNHTFVVNY